MKNANILSRSFHTHDLKRVLGERDAAAKEEAA
jgi:hypothetical protein